MSNFRQQRWWWMASITVLLPISFAIGVTFGATQVPLMDMLLPGSGESRARLILEQIRLPRAMLAALVGAMLGICGAATQGLFRNPLADPSLIGVTAGASAGAAVMILFAAEIVSLQSLLGVSIVSLGAFLGGAAAVTLVYSIATGREGTSVATMLLAGIAISAISGGLTSLVEFFADNEMLRRISLWRMGGLDGANYSRVMMGVVVALLIVGLLPRFSTALNALLLGESEARHLGISVQKTKVSIVLLVALGVATSVALAGSIVFVGLIVPHIVRLLIGPDHRYLLPMSAVGGAVLLLLADLVSRTIFAPIELPVGLVTAFLGAPFFISLLRQRQRYGFN